MSLSTGWQCASFVNGLSPSKLDRALKNMFRAAARVKPRTQPLLLVKMDLAANPIQPWFINVNVPGGQHFTVQCEGTMSCIDLYNHVLFCAATNLKVDTNDIYSLYNGKHYGSVEAPLTALGMYDSCFVDVFLCVKGGVFLPSQASQKKRKVSI